MQQKAYKSFTYQTRPKLDNDLDEILTETAKVLSKVERHLLKDLQKKKNINELKSFYIKHFKITARYFNSCRIKLDGKVSSYKKLLEKRILNLQSKTKKLIAYIEKITNPFKAHQKKRRLYKIEKELEKLKKDKKENKIRICFGSKELFKKQFNLEKNGFPSLKEWKSTWDDERNNSFFVIGSKDEINGNQTCQLIRDNNELSLHLRLPNLFSKKNILIKNISFPYGHNEIMDALKENEKRREMRLKKEPYNHLGKAINYLFKKDKKGWRIFVTIQKDKPTLKTKTNIGTIGLDINADHIALAETDRFGNIIDKKKISCSTYGKNKNQRLAIIGEAAKEIIKIALLKEKPIAIENLKFETKKLSLKENSTKYSRMLSSFAYNQILNFIENKAYKEGVEVYKVNPAFTSIIGKIKFSNKYGLSSHQAAAFAIARRASNYSEKFPSCLEIIDNKSSKSAFFLPERNRKKHVWGLYSEFIKMTKAANVLHLSTKFRSLQDTNLVRDNSIIYQGSLGTLIVNKTARLTC